MFRYFQKTYPWDLCVNRSLDRRPITAQLGEQSA